MPLQQPVERSFVRHFTSPERLAAELPRWEDTALGRSASTPMQTRSWIVACAETFVRDESLDVIVLEDAGGIAAVAPMVCSASFPAVNHLLGVRELSEPSDFIYRDEAALDSLMQVVAHDGRPLILNRVPTGSASMHAVRRGFRARGLVVSRPGVNHPSIALSGNAPGLPLSSSLRSDLRRAQRKAEALGTVTYEVYAPRSAAEFHPLYQRKLQVEASGWKGRDGTALAMNAGQRAFFNRYGVLASEEGILRLAVMRINGVVTAMQYAVQWKGAFWLLKIGHDEAYAKCSPGMLLLQHTLRYAMEQGLHSYEFLGAAESWTRRWTSEEKTTARLTVYPFGARGMFSLGRDSFRLLGPRLAARIEARARVLSPPPEIPATPVFVDELAG
jgi:CelD/BcsL family acetyltransferase involved in cellulose biosynthesis